jgi:hypothetical protein
MINYTETVFNKVGERPREETNINKATPPSLTDIMTFHFH